MASLSVRNLSKSFGRTKVLEDVSFDVKDGEFCVLLGPSGCGKSTLLRLIAGLESSSSGTISIGSRQVDRLAPGERDVAFVFQNYALYPHLTAFENLAFSLRLRHVSKEEIRTRVLETAKLLEIEDRLQQKPHELSGGQRQRVAVGRAIIRRPQIFLFDEPLSNLDATLRANMRIELARLHEKLGSTVVYVTHDQTEALTLGQNILILNEGAVQQTGTPSEIYHRPANTFVAGFVGSPRMNLIEGQIETNGEVFSSGTVRLDLSGTSPHLKRTYAGRPVTLGIRPENLDPIEPSASSIAGQIDIIEDLGADRFVHLRCGTIDLVARVDSKLRLKRGETLHLKVPADRLHLFFDGKRIN